MQALRAAGLNRVSRRRGGGPSPAPPVTAPGPVSYGGGTLLIDIPRRQMTVRGVVPDLTPEDTKAVLTVADTGTGIPAHELPRVFDRFWRGRQAAQASGSGIGLAVAAELARAHDGQLAARSAPGQGTVLSLTLPRV